MLGHDIKCISTVDWILKKPLTYIIRFQSDSLPAVKRLRSRTACVDMPGVPLLSCVFLGKSLTQSEVTSFTICKMRIITVPTPRVSQELSEIISGKRFKHAALDKY